MKNISLFRRITFLLAIILLGACSEDFLDLPPKSTGTVNQFYKSAADFETAIVGLYGKFANINDRELMLYEFRVDNLTHFHYFYQEYTTNLFGLSTTNIHWSIYTQVIHPANVLLSKIDDVDMDTDIKNRIKGEALFFRGFAYYTLNLWFGGVPKVTTPLTIEESLNLGRSTEDEIWDFVETDLTEAVSLLDPSVEIGRVDKYDAESYLAKAYMQRQKWGDAKTALADVFANSGASLEEVWTNMWTMEAEKSSKEYMLSVIYSPTLPNNDFSHQFLYMEDIPAAQMQGLFRYEPGFFESFEDGDLRRDNTLGFTPNSLHEENRKYIFGWDNSQKRFIGDIVILRFSDVLLMYAEAISMDANSVQQQSLDLINETRNRAGLGDITMADVPSLNDFIEVILAERRSELALEGHRYADLKRHGKLIEKLNAIGYNFDKNFNYIPIPQEEIDKSGGILIQNPGY